jgi:periplasmic protein TonB
MDFFHPRILLQSIAMTNKEILQADLLDILFENRNKAYGAYALRKYYNRRLLWALGISLGLVLFLFMMNSQPQNIGNSLYHKPDVVVRTLAIANDKPNTPKPPPPRKPSQVAQLKSTAIKIVPNDEVKKPEVPSLHDLDNAAIATVNKIGVSTNSFGEDVQGSNEKSNTGEQARHGDDEFHLMSSDAQFPGGREAFAEFLKRYLNTPGDLEVGEKRVVLVRFMVDADGVISKIEIAQTGGEKYDREMIRVLRKMPKWTPAMQNGIRVATYFTQPVTFVGIEE